MRALSGFMARVPTGYFGQGKQVKHCTVSSAITSIDKAIELACKNNPKKIIGSDKLIPRLQVMLDGYCKATPPPLLKSSQYNWISLNSWYQMHTAAMRLKKAKQQQTLHC
jgi:hypothetical protein